MANIEPQPEPGPGQELVEWIVQPPYGPTTYLNKYRVRNEGDQIIIDSADRPALEAEGLIAPLEGEKSLKADAQAELPKEPATESDAEADEAGDEPKTKKRK